MKNSIKKVVTAGLAGFVLGTTLTVSAGTWIQAYRNDEIKITLNGEVQTFRDATTNEIEVPITYNDRTYLPLRSLATLVGLNVDYDANTKTAILETKDYEGKKVKKIDETKDIVYKTYEREIKVETGNNPFKYEYPFINIDSKDVASINEKISGYIEKCKKIENKVYEDYPYIENPHVYYVSINDNLLTIVLGSWPAIGEQLNVSYCSMLVNEVYNIDIYTGKILDTKEVLKIANNINVEDIKLKEIYDEMYINCAIPAYLRDEFRENGKLPEKYSESNMLNEAYQEYLAYYTSKKINDIHWFVDDNKNIIAEMNWYTPYGATDGSVITEQVNVTEFIKGKGNNYFIIQDSDKKVLEESEWSEGLYPELNDFSNSELNIAYNEIFARHGHDFQSQSLKEHFNNQIWYKPVAGKQVTLEELNEIEKENARIIKQEIEERKALLNELK